jgi:hypothetical protein
MVILIFILISRFGKVNRVAATAVIGALSAHLLQRGGISEIEGSR